MFFSKLHRLKAVVQNVKLRIGDHEDLAVEGSRSDAGPLKL